MNIPPSEADRLSIEEYEMLIYHWNEAHGEGNGDVVDPEITNAKIEALKKQPHLLQKSK